MTIQINVEEFRSRVFNLQRQMQEKGIDHMVVYSWKRGQTKYLAGYFPNYVANTAAVLVRPKGDPKLFIRFDFDLDRAQRESWLGEIEASGSPQKMARDIADEIHNGGKGRGKVGVVGGDYLMDEIPHSFYAQLQSFLPNQNFVDGRSMLMDLRIIKTPHEIDAIKRSAKLADEGLLAAKDWIKPGVREREVVATIESVLRQGGGDNHLVVIAAPGGQKLIGPPTDRKLSENEDVIIEIGVELGGYWSQVAGVFFTNPGSADQLNVRSIVYEAYKNMVDQIKPGRRCSEIARLTEAFFADRGFKNYIEQDFGHGIGLDLPEPPKVAVNDHTVIRPGMILVVHPALRLPNRGGAFIGGTLAVDESGAGALHDLSILYKGE